MTTKQLSAREESIKNINLKVIQKIIDPNAIDVIFTTPRCAIYNGEYNLDQKKVCWEKSGVEGSLYLYKYLKQSAITKLKKKCEANGQALDFKSISKTPKNVGWGFTILNKGNDKSIKHYLEDIEVQLNEPYILYRNIGSPDQCNVIKGIWFSDTPTFMQIGRLMVHDFKKFQKGLVGEATTLNKNKIKSAAKEMAGSAVSSTISLANTSLQQVNQTPKKKTAQNLSKSKNSNSNSSQKLGKNSRSNSPSKRRRKKSVNVNNNTKKDNLNKFDSNTTTNSSENLVADKIKNPLKQSDRIQDQFEILRELISRRNESMTRSLRVLTF